MVPGLVKAEQQVVEHLRSVQQHPCRTHDVREEKPATGVLVRDVEKDLCPSPFGDALGAHVLRTTLDILHAKRDMRLSGTLVAGDASITFRRLKRAQRTIVDRSTDLPLPDDALAPFLGATDRAGFLSTNGLDRERLRQGGKALLAGGGDLAHALMAAAPGLAGLLKTRDRLAEEAAGFHNHVNRVGNNDLKAATAARDAAKRAIRDG